MKIKEIPMQIQLRSQKTEERPKPELPLSKSLGSWRTSIGILSRVYVWPIVASLYLIKAPFS
jgi:hypothetical protein